MDRAAETPAHCPCRDGVDGGKRRGVVPACTGTAAQSVHVRLADALGRIKVAL
jgi:hypothetical protein